MFENVDVRADDGVIGILIAHLGVFGSGELIIRPEDRRLAPRGLPVILFYPILTRIMDSFSCSPLYLIIFSIYPEYAEMQFQMMTLLDVLGKIAWVR